MYIYKLLRTLKTMSSKTHCRNETFLKTLSLTRKQTVLVYFHTLDYDYVRWFEAMDDGIND